MKRIRTFLIFSIALFSAACHQNEIYFQYEKVPAGGWNKDSLLRYDVHVTDTVGKYNFYIQIRHQGSYPYQNFWMFLDEMNTDSIAKKDTIECFLADQFGKWLGTGAGALKEMTVLYKKQVQFPDTGMYYLKITQGMRDSVLTGVRDVGLRIEKVVP